MTAPKQTETAPAPKPVKAAGYVPGSHAVRVRTEHDERRVELLSLRDVLEAQRDALDVQISDIGDALSLLSLLSSPGETHANIVAMAAE